MMASFDVSDALRDPHAYIIVAILAVLLVVVGLLIRSKTARGDAILLLGPCGAGKTTLLLQLEQGDVGIGTVSSSVENYGLSKIPVGKAGKVVEARLVDVPGHSRIFSSCFSQHIDRAGGIVFLVDSVDFMPHKEQIAQQLFQVLGHPLLTKRRMPVLLACNKADCGAKAHTSEFIRKRLEKGIDQLRSTQGTVSADGAMCNALERISEPFTFSALAKAHGAILIVAEISALQGDVEPVQDFMVQALHL